MRGPVLPGECLAAVRAIPSPVTSSLTFPLPAMNALQTPRPGFSASGRKLDAIAPGGAGCFLDPPNYPTHSAHVQTDRNRRKENRGMVSLTHAVDCEWISADTRGRAAGMIKRWYANPPAIDSEPVRRWIYQVLGYFRSCYIGPSGSRNASDLVVDSERDPMANPGDHAGVALIRDFYPDFTPTAADFDNARWGS